MTMSPRAFAVGVVAGVATILVIAFSAPLAGQTPTFRSATDVVAVDVQVVDRDGHPVAGLTPEDFAVTINGGRRRVLSANLIDATVTPRTSLLEIATAASGAATGSPMTTLARNVILAIDATSLDPSSVIDATTAARAFVAQSPPGDRIGLFTFPLGPRLDPTTDRAALSLALNAVTAQKDMGRGYEFNLRPSEIVDLASWADAPGHPMGSSEQLANAICGPGGMEDVPQCVRRLASEVKGRLLTWEGQAYATLGMLRGLFEGLSHLPGRKTVVLVSAGIVGSDSGGRPNLDELSTQIGKAAAQSNVAVYTVFLDRSLDTPFRAETGRPTRQLENFSRDSMIAERWLGRFSGIAGGALLRVIGDGSLAFGRIREEMRAYYLLAVQPAAADRDGRVYPMQIKVNRRGLEVRGRSWVSLPAVGATSSLMASPRPDATATAATPVTAPAPRPLPASARSLAAAFARKDYAAFEEELSKTGDLANLIRDVRMADAAWPDAPKRSAVFAIELALSGLFSTNGFARDEGARLLAQTHTTVRQPGETGDEFECTWYWTETAALEALQQPELGLLFLQRARQRCPTHPRLSLAQAVLTEQQWQRDADPRQLAEVLARYEEALKFPDVEPEARVRAAWFASRTGGNDRALALLGDQPSPSPDRQVRYLHNLILGRALQNAGRSEEAAEAFRLALVAFPNAQSARVGLMTTNLRAGASQEAAALSDSIQTAEAAQLDPWWMYPRGDFRGFTGITSILRGLGQ